MEKLAEAVNSIQNISNHSECRAADMYLVEEMARTALATWKEKRR